MASGGDVSNIKLEPVKVLWDEVDLGLTDGDIAVGLTENKVEVSAHQLGSTIPDQIITGRALEISVTLKEVQTANIAKMLQPGGAASTAAAEVTDITAIADVGGALDGLYFTLNSALDATQYYVWMNVDAGGNDPAPAGLTGIAVAVTTGDAASVIAGAMASAIGALGDFGAAAVGDVCTVTNAAVGGASDAADVDSGFTLAVTTQGASEVTGWGSNKDFTNISAYAKRLRFHPVALADDDRSRDFTAWLAYPDPTTLTYSGENPQTLEVSFLVIPDSSRDSKICMFAYGESR